jgi:hypothetical protein
MRRDGPADVDQPLVRFCREIDDGDAAVWIRILAENAAAVHRRVDLRSVRRVHQLMGRAGHVDLACERQPVGIEELDFIGGLRREDQVRPGRAVVGVDGHLNCRLLEGEDPYFAA